MDPDEEPALDPLVGGLTRPPMMFGIPYVLFVLEFAAIVLIFINTKNLLMFLLVVPIHTVAYGLTVRDAREEIITSKKKLEDTFGVAVDHFCYPYGDFSPGVRDLVREAGYRSACTTLYGINTPETPAFELCRLAVRHPTRTLKTLGAALSEAAAAAAEFKV